MSNSEHNNQLTGASIPKDTSEAKSSKKAVENAAPMFPIVGIGASAGGIEAITELLAELPSTLGTGIVIVVHLDRKLPSRLVEILIPQSAFPVVEAINGMLVQPNHIYVIPPNKELHISCGMLQVSPRSAERRLYDPVDGFFISLARDHGENAIGIVLSGMGADGSLGIQEIKARGGVTFAQEENSAKYPSMPASAIKTGKVDFVLSPAEIGKELIVLAKAMGGKIDSSISPYMPSDSKLREALLSLLHSRTEVDFSNYKQSTIWRRVHRRMSLKKMVTLREYVEYCQAKLNEVDNLYQDILINVTSFFRDADVFAALEKTAFPALVENRVALDPIRVWVPGCSTGEEAYSLAIALLDYLSAHNLNIPIQIFGTDINESVVDRARSGIYSERISENVSEDRLNRYFTKVPRGYQVTKPLRELCVFAKQNIVADPPLSKMDFISCRNLLIYLGPTLQRKVVPRLHYALKSDGCLLLGKSEVVDIFADLFFALDKRAKIYGKKNGASAPVDLGTRPVSNIISTPRKNPPAAGGFVELETQREVDRLIATRYSPPSLVINDSLQILQVRGDIKPYIDMGSGLWNNELEKLVQHDFVKKVRELVAESIAGRALSTTLNDLKIRTSGGITLTDLRFIPLRSGEENERRFLLVLEGKAPIVHPLPVKIAQTSFGENQDLLEEVSRLSDELRLTRDQLQSTIDEREIRNEELQAANEEILSNNEELQTMNQELETSKEELESANEELATLNEELQRHLEQLRQSEERFRILVSGVREYAIFMLDRNGIVLSWNEGAQRIKGYKSEEIIGKHFSVFYPAEIANSNKLNERLEIAARDGSYSEEGIRVRKDGSQFWASVVITALFDEKGNVYGYAKVTRDITERRLAEEKIKVSEERFRILVSGVKDYAIYMMDLNGYILSWNEGAQRINGYRESEIIGRHFSAFYTEEDKKRNHPQAELETARKTGKYEEEGLRVRKGGKTFLANVVITALYDASGKLRGFAKVTRDVTDKRKSEDALREAHTNLEKRVLEATETVKKQAAHLELITNALPTLISYIELDGRYSFNNDAYRRWFGVPVEMFTGQTLAESLGEKAYHTIKPHLERAYAGQKSEFEALVRYRFGPSRFVRSVYIPDMEGPEKVRGVIALVEDVTERKRSEEELRRYSDNLVKMNAELIASNAELSQFAHVSSHDLKEPLRMVKVYSQMIENTYRDRIDAKGQKFLSFVIEGVDRMEALINDLLSYTAVGKSSIPIEDADLARAASVAVMNLSQAISEANAQVSLGELPIIRGNETQLIQVFQNLIGNAIKFKRAERPEIKITCEDKGKAWEISVKDNGIGIDPQFSEKIFLLFQRLHDRARYPGTGIGLAICKRIVERHGGNIWFVSRLGAGSTFYFTIPKEPRN